VALPVRGAASRQGGVVAVACALVLPLSVLVGTPAMALSGGEPVSEVAAGAGADAPLARVVATHLVAFQFRSADGGGSFCSGTLVHPEVVLTAAHCVAGLARSLPRMVVSFGPEVREALAAGRSATREVVSVEVHPDFERLWRKRGAPTGNEAAGRAYRRLAEDDVSGIDVALLLLHRSAPDTHRPAVIGTLAGGARTARLVIAGYGKTGRADESSAGRLRLALLPGRRLGERADSTAIWLDAGIAGGKRVNACPGDSGGGIFMDDGRVLRQLGVVAAGDAGCREVSLFTAIAAQRTALHEMFDRLTAGTAAQRDNPF
jgi:hypothetical protein